MITKEVNNWIKKVEMSSYSDEDLLYEFQTFAKYLSKEDLIHIKKRLENSNIKFKLF